MSDLGEFRFLQSPGGGSGSTHADTAGHEGAAGLVGHGVLVHRDVGVLQQVFHLLAGHFRAGEVQQQQVVVGSAGYHADAFFTEGLFHGLRIQDDLMLIGPEVFLQRFAEADSLTGDHMLQRAALGSGEDSLVDGLGILFTAQDHTAAGTAQGLVGGGSHKISKGDGAGMLTGGHQAGDVRHIHHQQGADFVRDFPQFLEINHAGISGSACDDHLRLAFQGNTADVFVIDHLGFGRNAVRNKIEIGTGHIHRAAVGQVTAVGQSHAHHRVTGLQHGEINSHVGLGTAVGLDVGVFRAEELAGSRAGQILDNIHALASAVIAFSRIAFRVFVRKAGTHGSHNRRRNKVLAGDQLHVGPLTVQLQPDGLGYFRISLTDQFQFHCKITLPSRNRTESV